MRTDRTDTLQLSGHMAQETRIRRSACGTAKLRPKILDFGGFDSSRFLILSGGILMSVGNVPESFRPRENMV